MALVHHGPSSFTHGFGLVLIGLVLMVQTTGAAHVATDGENSCGSWKSLLPTVRVPFSFLTSPTTVKASTAARFAAALQRGKIILPATTARFCEEAGLICQEDFKIPPYFTNNTYTCPGARVEHLVSINDFQSNFFLESDLKYGAQMKLDRNLNDPIPRRSFLPKEVAEQFPELTMENLNEILHKFNIGQHTDMATIMATATYLCGNLALPGETRACPTTLEALAEYVASQLGNRNVEVLATTGAPSQAPTISSPVTITGFTKRSLREGEDVVACHNIMWPSQLLYCHHVHGTKIVEASLAVADNTIINGVAICHLNTALWAARHPAFAALNIRKGAEACHWSGANDLIFVSNET